jgi:hypothetical protein
LLCHIKNRIQVGPYYRVPISFGHFFKGHVAGNPSVVDEDVNGADFRLDFRDGIFARIEVRHIHFVCLEVITKRFHGGEP